LEFLNTEIPVLKIATGIESPKYYYYLNCVPTYYLKTKKCHGSTGKISGVLFGKKNSSSRSSILSEKASKTGKFSVAILKIVEFPQSDFLKWLEQCNLYAACLTSFSTLSCRGGRPRRFSIAAVGVVLIQPVIH
jgi:hypothetical protein